MKFNPSEKTVKRYSIHPLPRPKKGLGQHFLKDANALEKIATALSKTSHSKGVNATCSQSPEEMTPVIEIGPGQGALTEVLLAGGARVISIELDKGLEPILKSRFQRQLETGQFRLIFSDILHTSLAEVAGTKRITVGGNIPYYITTPILFKLIEQRDTISRAVLLIQKEVAERLVAKRGTKAYGILAVQLQALAKLTLLFEVNRNAFFPPPNVESAVVEIEFTDRDELRDLASVMRFRQFVRVAFRMRRKTLFNNLKGHYHLDASQVKRSGSQMMYSLGGQDVDLMRRAESFSIDEFIFLSTHFEPSRLPEGLSDEQFSEDEV